jgi:hypothetical protein
MYKVNIFLETFRTNVVKEQRHQAHRERMKNLQT